MNKFFLLLKKEVRELLTPQMLLPFAIVMIVFSFIGDIAKDQINEQAKAKPKIAILNLDKTELSLSAEEAIKGIAQVEKMENIPESSLVEEMNKRGILVGLVIPEGFSESIDKNTKANLRSYAILNNFSLLATQKYAVLDAATSSINEFVSNSLIGNAIQNTSALDLKNPIKTQGFVSSKDVTVEGNASEVLGFVSQQTTYVPIILFIVIIFAAQMIASAVATEKEDKTLETLLSLPISRKVIVSAKMLSAGLVSLLMAVVYMYGMKNFTSGMSSTAPLSDGTSLSSASQISESLGLKFTTLGYAELGIILFLGILLALAVAMILGAFSEDAKSAQSVIAPLMVLVMIPYFITMFLDVNQLSSVAKWLIYAIPFSHIFLAAPNILLGKHVFIIYGALYLLALFIVFVLIAAKIFSSDLILTMKLNFSKKKK